jgi:putative FmdB family regulatory protein
MPIYEYICQKCGHDFEALQKVSDAPLRKCPECGALRLRKLVSKPTFRLKGSGWYETDFKKDKKRLLAEPAGGQAGDGKESADAPGKSETKGPDKGSDKPEKKADTKPAKAAASSTGTTSD